MSTAAAPAVSATELLGPTRSIPAVEIFAAGLHRGKWYTTADLKRVVQNYQRFAARRDADVTPVLVGGHGEEQVLMSDAGLPNYGLVRNLRLVGPKLVADFADVPEVIARLIAARRYNTVSAEFWPDLVDGGQHYGLTLRRVALLGGDMPQVKSLNAGDGLPAKAAASLAFSDRVQPMQRWSAVRPDGRRLATKYGTVICFSEARPMDREQMMALVQSSGQTFSEEFLNSLSDEQLAMLIQSMTPAPPEPVADDTPAEFNDLPPAPAPASPTAPGVPAATPSKVTLQYHDQLTRRVAETERRLAAADRMAAERLNREKAAKVDAFWDQFVAAGVRLPAQEAETKRALMRCDAVKALKFSDRPDDGPMSELEREAKTILAGPKLIKFGDQMTQPKGGTAGGSDAAATRRRMLAGSPIGRAILKQEQAKAG